MVRMREARVRDVSLRDVRVRDVRVMRVSDARLRVRVKVRSLLGVRGGAAP